MKLETVMVVIAAGVVCSGCALSVGGRTLTPGSLMATARSEQDAKARAKAEADREAKIEANAAARDAERKAEAAERAEREKAQAAAFAERQKEAAKQEEARLAKEKELAAKAATKQTLVIPELGVRVTVPGDVEYRQHHSNNLGEPAVFLEGKASGFALILANAAEDRYGKRERMDKQLADFNYNLTFLRQQQKPDGSWEFEYVSTVYLADGSRAGQEFGYFSRRNIGKKKINCLISGLWGEKALTGVVKVCQGMAAAPATAAR